VADAELGIRGWRFPLLFSRRGYIGGASAADGGGAAAIVPDRAATGRAGSPMIRLRASMIAWFMLMVVSGIIVPFFLHIHRETHTHETVWAIEFSPDRKLMARGSSLGVAVFEIDSQRLIKKLDIQAGCLAFSKDSRMIATGELHGSVKVWDAVTGSLLDDLPGHSAWVRAIAFSPDSTLLYSASRDGMIKVWQVSNGALVSNFSSKIGEFESMALSPNGELLAAGPSGSHINHNIELWNIKTGTALTTIAGPEYCYVYKLAFSPDNSTLAVGLSVPMVRLWDVFKSKSRISLPEASGRDLVSFSPTGKLLVTSFDGGVQIWDTAEGQETARLEGHLGNVLWAAISSNESTLTTAGEDGTVRTWDLLSAKQTHRVSGLTLRAQPIPWVMLAGFGLWLIAWCGLKYLGHRRSSVAGLSSAGFVLVVLSVMFTITNGMSIIWLSQTTSSPTSPIGVLCGWSLMSFIVFIGFSLTLTLGVIRSSIVLWAFSSVLVTFVLLYNLHLLAEVVASA
jgi:WD40 repeat protein